MTRITRAEANETNSVLFKFIRADPKMSLGTPDAVMTEDDSYRPPREM